MKNNNIDLSNILPISGEDYTLNIPITLCFKLTCDATPENNEGIIKEITDKSDDANINKVERRGRKSGDGRGQYRITFIESKEERLCNTLKEARDISGICQTIISQRLKKNPEGILVRNVRTKKQIKIERFNNSNPIPVVAVYPDGDVYKSE